MHMAWKGVYMYLSSLHGTSPDCHKLSPLPCLSALDPVDYRLKHLQTSKILLFLLYLVGIEYFVTAARK